MFKLGVHSQESALAVLVVLSTLAVWLPFLLEMDAIAGIQLKESGRQVLDRYLDGPLYVVVSKTLYSQESPLYAYFNFPKEIFSEYFPLYPLVILLFSFIGFFNSMLFATLLSSIGATLAFYFLLRDFKLSKKPFLMAVFFIFFPFRWVVYHSVGASEPLFLMLSLSSFYFFRKGEFWGAGIAGALAVLTRPLGVLLFPAFVLHQWLEKPNAFSTKRQLPLLLIPFFLLALIVFFAASFSTLGAASLNLIYFQGPLSVIPAYAGAVGGEFAALLLLLYSLGSLRLFEQKHYDFFIYSVLHLIPFSFLAINDLSRLLVPIAPFALFLGFKEVWENKYAKYLLPFIAAAALLYAWSTIPTNLLSESIYRSIFS